MLDSYLIKNGTLVSILDGRERKADILVERGMAGFPLPLYSHWRPGQP